jgi:hypothetical protein
MLINMWRKACTGSFCIVASPLRVLPGEYWLVRASAGWSVCWVVVSYALCGNKHWILRSKHQKWAYTSFWWHSSKYCKDLWQVWKYSRWNRNVEVVALLNKAAFLNLDTCLRKTKRWFGQWRKPRRPGLRRKNDFWKVFGSPQLIFHAKNEWVYKPQSHHLIPRRTRTRYEVSIIQINFWRQSISRELLWEDFKQCKVSDWQRLDFRHVL